MTTMTVLQFVVGLLYLLAASLFVVGLHLMRSPSTARRGNFLSAVGMVIAIVATVVLRSSTGAHSIVGLGRARPPAWSSVHCSAPSVPARSR